MLPVVLIFSTAAVVGFIVAVATRPSEFRIFRTATMAAPLSPVFERVNDLRNWADWSPWARMDPNMEKIYSGPDAGAGATHAWKGNRKVGQGRMTITESRTSELIRIKLEFLKPFKATNTAEFTFKPVADKTEVTWSMSGKNGIMGKVFSLFVNMDKMVGSDFEKGLASLKEIAEGTAQPPSA
jgi:hypothetical protein